VQCAHYSRGRQGKWPVAVSNLQKFSSGGYHYPNHYTIRLHLEYYQSYDLSRELARGSLPSLPSARGHPTYGTTPNRLVANGGNDEWGRGHLPAWRQWPARRFPQDILAAICPFQGAAVLSRTHMLPHSRFVLPWDPIAIQRSAVSGTQ
jgi:hypothetical protein